MADLYYDSVSLLLHCDGTNGSTTFIDNSPTPKTITPAGSAQISTTQSKFGTASASFDGSGDYLALDGSSDFIFGTNDFTIEFNVYFNSGGVNILYDHASSGSSGLFPTIYRNYNSIVYAVSGTDLITGAGTINTNTWYHIAVSRNGTSTRLFVDGIQLGSTYTGASNLSVAPTRPMIGGNGTSTTYMHNGYIDELRVTKGVARYTANFTPPIAAYELGAALYTITGNSSITVTPTATLALPSYVALPFVSLANTSGYGGWVIEQPFVDLQSIQIFGSTNIEIGYITPSILASGYSTDLNSGTLTFIDSTIEGYGGAITEEEAINFVDLSTFSCTGTHLDYGNANIAFSTFTLSSTGLGYGTSNASIGFISSTITSFGGVDASLVAPVFSLSSTGSYIPLGGASLDFLTWSVSSTGTLDKIGNATIGFPTFTSVWGSAALPAPFLNLAATGSVAIANSVAYVLNIVTNESTRYTNQNWDHIVVLGNKPYGVTSTGLYLLEGATDNGVAIDTYMATKETDLGSNMAKSIPTIYLNSDTLTYTTAYMDGVAQTPQASSFSGRKCHLSRGAEARYVKLKISGIKNLQGLEILPEIKSRRVK